MKRSQTKTNLDNLDKTELVDTLLTNVKGGNFSLTCINFQCKSMCYKTNPTPEIPRIPGFGL